MIRGIQLAAIALVVAFAVPASAQNVRDHRRKRPQAGISVSGFAPQTGQVGTDVTIDGSGFTPDTQVIFGRAQVKPSSVSPTRLVVRVPTAHGDGTIVLRHPGISSDIDVGRFTVEVGLSVSSFAPASGVPGTRVLIRGSGFEPGVRVLLGAVDVPVLRVTPAAITVQLPEGTATGRITVTRGNQRADSPRAFQVLTPSPVIDSLSPEGGTGGTQVRIAGRNFGPDARARYGRTNMAIIARGAGFIDAQVPPNARDDAYIFVVSSSGESRSPRKFQLDPMPLITDVRPRFGIEGERVEVTGQNFRAGDRVTLDGRDMRILQLRATAMSVVVPSGARSGQLIIERGEYRVASTLSFEVLQPPTVTRIDPPGAPAGTRVEVVGTDLGNDTEVFYGARKLPIVGRSVGKAGRDRLAVVIPRGSDDRFFTVRTRAGEARSALFIIHRYPQVSEASPQRGIVGTLVTIRGTDVQQATQVLLGKAPVPIVERGADFIVVEITSAVQSGTFTLVSYGQRFDTRMPFHLVPTPIIRTFQPRSGPPGTEVVISGKNFGPSTRVFFGKTELTVLRANADRELTVRIPPDARDSELLFVGEANAIIPSKQPFVVVAPEPPPPPPPPPGNIKDHRKNKKKKRR